MVAPQGTDAGAIPVKFGKADTVTASTLSDLKVLTTKNQTGNFTTAIKLNDSITAPIKKGQELGQMMAVMDGKTVASTPITAGDDVEQAGFVSRMWESLVDWIKGLF
ncbi:hypothetical protein [Moraxella bovis]